MKAFDAFNNLPFGRQEVMEFTELLRKEIQDGEIDPLRAKIFFAGLQRIIEAIKEPLDDAAVCEAEKYGKSFEMYGAKLDTAEAGTKYDYSRCGHPKWFAIKESEMELANQRRDLERQLQSLKSATLMGDPETGESWEVYPPMKSSKTIVKITL